MSVDNVDRGLAWARERRLLAAERRRQYVTMVRHAALTPAERRELANLCGLPALMPAAGRRFNLGPPSQLRLQF